MRKWMTIALMAALAAGCGGETGTESGTAPEGGESASGGVLRWTAIPDTNPEELKAKYNPISEYLSEKLGVECEYRPVADYKASVEAFKTGDISLAWFGGLTGVQARAAVDGATAIAQGAEDPEYKSYFIAHKDTGLERSNAFPMEIGKLPFTFGSQSSTSGRLMPEFFIRQETGKSPQDFFSVGHSCSGAHDKTALLVQDGTEVKAGVLSYTTYDKMVAAGKLDPEVCRIVWVTPDYADYNFTAHPNLEEKFGAGFTKKLQDALIAMKDPKLLGAFPRSALIPASNEDFAKIESTAKDLGLLR
jgi:phosphonate transport system substrate-binding protein